MKRLIYLHILWFLCIIKSEAQNVGWDSQHDLKFSLGSHFFAPIHSSEPYGSIEYNYYHSNGDGIKKPKIALLLNPAVMIGGRLKSADESYQPFRPLQPGVVSFVPSIIVSNFVDNDDKKNIELFAQIKGGVNYYPIPEEIKQPRIKWYSHMLNGYDQWQLGLGAGIKFRSVAVIDAFFYRASYNISTNTRVFFKDNFKQDVFFKAAKVNATFRINKRIKGFISWQGFIASNNKEKFINAGFMFYWMDIKKKKSNESQPQNVSGVEGAHRKQRVESDSGW